MEITCIQMDVLISFYIEDELSASLKKKVEKHLSECPTCRAKYNIISSIFGDMKNSASEKSYEEILSSNTYPTRQYKSFRSNLSAYIDNELPPEENIKIKKYAINNKKARKDLEENYNVRKLMNESFRKSKSVRKADSASYVLEYKSRPSSSFSSEDIKSMT